MMGAVSTPLPWEGMGEGPLGSAGEGSARFRGLVQLLTPHNAQRRGQRGEEGQQRLYDDFDNFFFVHGGYKG